MFGLKVIVTSQGPDYDREKWGRVAKYILKKGEKYSAKYAHEVIGVSNVIDNIYKELYSRNNCHVIYNGVTLPVLARSNDYITSLGLEKNKYIIGCARFVEEKGFHDLINAYLKQSNREFKLVLVGDAIHETQYSKDIKKRAKQNGIIITGFISGNKLNEIFSHANLFIMPSYHEGLPLALLEAMSYNLDILVSNIPANLEVGLKKDDYFLVGNVNDLSKKMNEKLAISKARDFSSIILDKYNWEIIASQTIEVYRLANKK